MILSGESPPLHIACFLISYIFIEHVAVLQLHTVLLA